MQIRELLPEEHDLHTQIGALTVAAYEALYPDIHEDGYAAELADVAARVQDAAVLAALDDPEGTPLGGVTYVPDRSSPFAEFDEEDAAGIRMLAVAPEAQGRGVGEALTRACIERARTEGRRQIVLHSTERMTTAHRIYGRLGFARDESLDWTPQPDLRLIGFRLRL